MATLEMTRFGYGVNSASSSIPTLGIALLKIDVPSRIVDIIVAEKALSMLKSETVTQYCRQQQLITQLL